MENENSNKGSTISTVILVFFFSALSLIGGYSLSFVLPLKSATKAGAACNDQFLKTIVTNKYIEPNLKLCGAASLREPCKMYIQNTSYKSLKMQSLFKIAAPLSQRNVTKSQIENKNSVYANQVVKPGQIAEFHIPQSQE